MSNQQIINRLKSRSQRIQSNDVKSLPVEFTHGPQELKLWCRYTPWQLLTSVIFALFFLMVIVTMISLYLFKTPDLILKSTTFLSNPVNTLDLTALPEIQFSGMVNIRVSNPNIIPVPVHIIYEGSFDSINPSERVISGELYNQVLPSRGSLNTAISANIALNLLQHQIASLTKIFDACGMFGGGRSTIKVNIYATVWIGYGIISFPIKETIYPGLIIQCPLLEENLGQLALNLADKLLPFKDQYNNTINDILMGTKPLYLPL